MQKFQASLSPDQQLRLRVLQSVPDAQAVVTFTAQLDAENAKRRSRCVASRLERFLSSVQQFTGVINTLVSSNPQIAALVWGSVKLTLVVCFPIDLWIAHLTISRWHPTLPHTLINCRRFLWKLVGIVLDFLSTRPSSQTRTAYRNRSVRFMHLLSSAVCTHCSRFNGLV